MFREHLTHRRLAKDPPEAGFSSSFDTADRPLPVTTDPSEGKAEQDSSVDSHAAEPPEQELPPELDLRSWIQRFLTGKATPLKQSEMPPDSLGDWDDAEDAIPVAKMP